MFHRKAVECKMMRKLCLFLITILVVAACTTDESVMDVCQQKFQRRDFKEGYIPKGSPICVTLPNGLTLNMDEDSTYYLGDVLFQKSLVDSVIKSATRAAGMKNYVQHWNTYRIPYIITQTNGNFSFSDNDVQKIKTALNNISNACQLEFEEVTSSNSNYIRFIPGAEDGMNYSSNIGMQNGENTIVLCNNNFYMGTAMHEVLHILGYYHEQCRSDRDEYVNIIWDNIPTNQLKNQYQKYNLREEGYDIGNFDFNSIMMYSSYILDNNGITKTVMTKKNGDEFGNQRYYLTQGDQEALYFFYGEKPKITSEIIDEHYEFDISTDIYVLRDYKIEFDNVLQYPRYVAVTKEYLFRSSEDDRGTTAVEHLYFTIPAGVKEYYIGQGSYVEQRDYGNLTRLEETNYVLESI